VAKRIGQIIVSDVSEARIRTAFPDCDIAAVAADFKITFELRDLADAYGFLDRVRQTGAINSTLRAVAPDLTASLRAQ